MSISRVYLFGSDVHCLLLLLLLFAFRSPNGEYIEGSRQALQRIIPQADLRALEVQAPPVQVHQQVWALALSWLLPMRALSSWRCPWCLYHISSPFSGVSLDVLVVLHGVAGTQRLKAFATRTLEQAFTVDCFDDILLFVPLLAPAAS